MNRIKRELVENGTYLGEGSTRVAYYYCGKVWKFAKEETNQGIIEKEILDNLKKENVHNSAVPDIVYLNKNLCYTTEKVLPADDDFDYYDYCESYELDAEEIDSYFDYLSEVYDSDRDELENSIEELIDFGLTDIRNNNSNYGRIGNRLVVIDLGYSHSSSHLNY